MPSIKPSPASRWNATDLFSNEETITGSFLIVFSWINIAVMTVVLIAAMLLAPEHAVRLAVMLALVDTVFVGVVLLTRTGKVRLASYLTVTALWLLVTVFAYSGGGVDAPSYTGYLVVTFLAGMLIGGPAVFVTAGLSGLAGLAMTLLEQQGLLPPPLFTDRVFVLWLGGFGIMLILAFLQYHNNRSVKRSIERARLELEERTKAEQALREANDRYRVITENSGDVIWVWDLAAGRYTYISPSVQNLHGYTSEEALKLQFTDVLTAEAAAKAQAIAETLAPKLNAGEPVPSVVMELDQVCKDGSIVPTETALSLFLNQENQPQIIGISREISARKHAEEILKKNQALLAEAQRIGHIGHMEWIRGKEIVICSDELYTILGLSREGPPVTIRQIKSLLPPDEQQRILELDRQAFAQHENLDYEYRIIRPDGSERWLNHVGQITYGEDGQPQRILAIIQDVTGQKQAEQELVRKNRLYDITSRINQMIVRTQDPQTLFDEACKIAVENGSFRMAWVGLAEEASRSIQPVSRYGHYGTYLDNIHISIDDVPEGRGPTGTVFRTGAHFICNNIEHDPLLVPWHMKALAMGYRSSAAFPLRTAEKVIGVFTVYSAESGWFELEEIQLLDELASDISYALGFIEKEKERQRVELALRASNETSHAVLNASTESVFLMQVDGTVIAVNDMAAKRLRTTAPDMIGKNIYDLIPPEVGRVRRAHVEGVVRDGTPSIFEDQRQGIWMENSIYPITDPDGQIRRVAIYGRDITPRKQTENALRESEQKYRSLHESMIDGFVRTAMDGTILEFNEIYRQMLGYSAEELSRTTYLELTPQKWHAHESRILEEQILTRGYSDVYEKEYIRKNGSIFPAELHTVLLRDEQGQPESMWAIVRDITERKTEERLTQARLKLASMAESKLGVDVLLQSILDEAESLTNSNIGFFHFVDGDGNNISLQTWSTNTLASMCTAEGKGQHYPVAQAGVWADCVRSGAPCIYNDYPNMQQRTSLPHGHAQVTRLISVPVKRNDQVVAVIGVGNKPVDYTAKDVDLATRLAKATLDAVIRIRTEAALQASEEKYRGLLESLDSVIAMIDGEGRFLYVNDTAAERLGRPAAQIVGHAMHEVFPPEVAARQMKSIRGVITSNRAYVNEEISFVNGQQRWFRTSIQPLHNESGQVTSALLNSTDIHELKAAQQSLEELNRTLEQRVEERTAQVNDLYNNAPVGYHSIDSDLRITAINQTELDMLGYTHEELIGQHASCLFSEESLPSLDQAFQRLVSSGRNTDLEATAKRKDGSVFPVLINATAVYDSNGNYISSRISMTDIGERKRAELILRESEETYRALFENGNDAILLMDLNGYFLKANPQCYKLLGYQPEELIGHSSAEFVAPFELADADDRWARTLAGENTPVYERKLVHKDGSYVETDINLSLIRDAHGRPTMVQSVVRDITSRKRAENALRATNQELERALRVKDEFLANMSHELRTPLNAIIGLSDSLVEQTAGALNEKQQKYIVTINESGNHLLSLINDILDLAKIGAGELHLDLARVGIHTVCESSLRLVRQLAQKKNLHVRFEMDSDLETLLADERRLKQMLVNLLSNAVKFTPENGHIGLEVRGDRESHSIRFMVWDTGIGIKQEDQARLFKPFIQVNASMTREAGGTGLGLALVSQMAKLHGGSIKLDSVPGQGSRFTITLPWDNGTSRTDAQEQHTGKEAQPRKKSSSAGRQTILLVEDTEAVVMVVRDYLEFAGYNVEVAYSARDGIALARKVQPDLILMDVQMPGMDGLEATRILRGQEDFKTTPIIALTAFAMQSDRERSLAAGMNEHISKPVNLKDLVETIRSYLKGSQS